MSLKPKRQANAKATPKGQAVKNPPAKTVRAGQPPLPATEAPQQGSGQPVTGQPTPGRAAQSSPDARARPGTDTLPDGWEEQYFAHLGETCQKDASARRAGVCLRTVQRRRNADPAFAERERESMGGFANMIESEITRRAIEGIVSVTMSKDGKTITTKTEYSDTLLLRLAERLETGSWRQKQQIEQTVSKAWFPTRADRKAALEKARAEAAVARAAALGGGELPRV